MGLVVCAASRLGALGHGVAFAAVLKGAHDRLDMLDAGDLAASVRTVISWSYQNLGTQAARMFRLLGLHPGLGITRTAAASLAAAPLDEARAILRDLAHTRLISEHLPGRYAFHDLLRAYAAERVRECDSDAARRTATGRMLDHYLRAAHAAAFLLKPTRPNSITMAAPGLIRRVHWTCTGRALDVHWAFRIIVA